MMSNRYIHHYALGLENLEKTSLRRKLKISESATAPSMKINGRDMLTFCSNDYLGLANHPALSEALKEGVDAYGAGSGASHMIIGHSLAHAQLELALAKTQSTHIPEATALFISTGYMANVACITALSAGLHIESTPSNHRQHAQMSIYSEELNHASLIDGVRLAHKQNNATIHVYPHQNLTHLENLLKEDRNPFKLIISDAVFSMDGNIAKIDQLLDLAATYDALLMIDDAHGFGVLGEQGHGVLEYFGISAQDPRSSRLIYIGTLGKAAGLSGAFIAAHPTLTEWVMQKGRAYIYTTATPPSIAHGLLKSLDLMSDASHRNNLNSNIAYWKKNLHLKKWHLMPSDTAIQPILIGSNEAALNAAKALDIAGIWVSAIRPPTVPAGSARLRVTLSASHTHQQIDILIKSLHDIENQPSAQ